MKRMLCAVLVLLLLLSGCGTVQQKTSAPEPAAQTNDPMQDKQLLYSVNSFLSIFAQQKLESYRSGATDREALIAMLFSYIKTYTPAEIKEKPLDAGGMIYESVNFETVNKASEKLLGTELNREEMKDYIVTRYSGDVISSVYDNGEFFFYPEAGEPRSRIAAAQSIALQEDGSLRVLFTVYSISYEAISGSKAAAEDFYGLTSSEAASSELLKQRGTGEAVVLPVSAGETAEYILMSLTARYEG